MGLCRHPTNCGQNPMYQPIFVHLPSHMWTNLSCVDGGHQKMYHRVKLPLFMWIPRKARHILKIMQTLFTLESWISLQQDQFLLVTQAFASPPDMASSGVWENVILPKTPTFEGVSGILYYIIFLNLLPNFWYCWQMVSQLLLCWQILVNFDWGLTDVIVNCCLPLCLADVIALWYMAINAFVIDAIVTFLWNRSILRL